VVVTKAPSCCEHNARCLQLGEETLRLRDAAEGNASTSNFRQHEIPSYSPEMLGCGRSQLLFAGTVCEYNGVSAGQCGKRFSKPPGGKQRVLYVTRRDQDNIEVARQPPMLKAIIQQVHLNLVIFFGKLPGGEPVFSYDDRYSEFASDQ
jgi:hypothetical protein